MAQTLNHHQAWLSLNLSRFDYSLTHRASKHSAKPNALSRCVDHQVEGEDHEDQVMLPTKCFASEPPVSTLKQGAQRLWTKSVAALSEMNWSYVP